MPIAKYWDFMYFFQQKRRVVCNAQKETWKPQKPWWTCCKVYMKDKLIKNANWLCGEREQTFSCSQYQFLHMSNAISFRVFIPEGQIRPILNELHTRE